MGGDDRQKIGGVLGQLLGPHPFEQGEAVAVGRALVHHLLQDAVVEDDVGRHPLGLRQLAALGPQGLPQGTDQPGPGGAALAPACFVFDLGLWLVAAQPEPGLAPQHRPGGLCQEQGTVPLDVHPDEPGGDQLAEHGTPLRDLQVLAQAEDLEPVVTVGADAQVRDPAQDIRSGRSPRSGCRCGRRRTWPAGPPGSRPRSPAGSGSCRSCRRGPAGGRRSSAAGPRAGR